jgi:predicted enzyme related to lactoylglutathione lyase
MTQSPGVNGGMYKKEEPDLKTINYFSVDKIEEYIKAIKKLGGTLTKSKTKVPGVGYIAQAVDPQGNPFAILQPLR